MASEPEKKIEELLRGYSRKRREDAGAPLEIHPATRRMLQGEVAKLAKAGQGQRRSFWQSFFLMWPRFAATVGMFAVLAVGIWVITQSEKKPTSQFAAEQPTAEFLSRAEGMIVVDAKKDAKPERDADALADVRVAREESLRKSVDSVKRRNDDVAYNEGKTQLRDLERAPADTSGVAPIPAPAAPQPVTLSESFQEKNVSLRYDSPSKPMLTAPENKVASSADKQSELAQKLAPAPETQLGQYFRQSAAEPIRGNEATVKAPVGELAAAAITGARFAGNTATNANLFSFADQLSATSAAGRAYFAKQPTNLFPAQALNDFAVAYSLQPPAASPAPATQGSAPASDLAKNERARSAPASAFAGVEIVTVKDEFERVDANATLLRTFEVQKSGERIQIRDADGSVYDGAILQRGEVGEKAKETREELRAVLAAETRLADANDQTISFRVSGTNKSLRQLVVINGEFVEQAELGLDAAGKVVTTAGAPAAPAVTSPSLQTRAQPAPARGQQTLPTNRALAEREALGRALSLSNQAQTLKASMIRARVLVGTNEVNVNAVRRPSDR